MVERVVEHNIAVDKDEEAFINSVMNTVQSVSSSSSSHDASYSGSRAAAMDEADMRNSFFRAAADAFSRGQPAVAAELAERGRSYGKKMKLLQNKASLDIFRERYS